MGIETAVAAGCDPHCRFKKMVEVLGEQKEQSMHLVPEEPYHGQSYDVRPTPAGYALLSSIHEAYTGLVVLEQVASNCKRTCEVERYVDTVPQSALGNELQESIKVTRGEQ